VRLETARTTTTAILAEGLDVSFHDSPEGLAAFVEAIDVRDGIYTSWLVDGHVIALDSPVGSERVSATVSQRRDPDGLRAKLLEYSAAIGLAPSELESLPLEALVDKVMAASHDWWDRQRGPVRKLLVRLMPGLFGH
jgi:hypothetical protein